MDFSLIFSPLFSVAGLGAGRGEGGKARTRLGEGKRKKCADAYSSLAGLGTGRNHSISWLIR